MEWRRSWQADVLSPAHPKVVHAAAALCADPARDVRIPGVSTRPPVVRAPPFPRRVRGSALRARLTLVDSVVEIRAVFCQEITAPGDRCSRAAVHLPRLRRSASPGARLPRPAEAAGRFHSATPRPPG